MKSGLNIPKENLDDNLILDPSFFAYRRVLSDFFRSDLVMEHRVIIPSLLYETVRLRGYERFVEVLSLWERKRGEELETVWSEVMDFGDRILQSFKPCSEVLKELSKEKREESYRIEKILSLPERRYWPRVLPAIDMAKEIVATASVTSLILSVSDKAKEWYNRLNGTVVNKMEENRTLMQIKEQSRRKMEAAGWKGRVLVWLAKHTPIPYSGDLVDVVTIIFADGTYRCQFCGRSLWRLPKDIKFCPYCSASLV